MDLPQPASKHATSIAMTTIFVVVVTLIILISTAVPLAVNTGQKVNNKKIQSASGYAWAAFVFELLSVILFVITMVMYYNCVERDVTRQKVWHERGESQMSFLTAAATGFRNLFGDDGATYVTPQTISSPTLVTTPGAYTASPGAIQRSQAATPIAALRAPAPSVTPAISPAVIPSVIPSVTPAISPSIPPPVIPSVSPVAASPTAPVTPIPVVQQQS